MATCAVIRSTDSVVVNVIIADVDDPAPDGCVLVDINGIYCCIGFSYNFITGEFVDPNPPSLEIE